ncbi:DUF6455 family protein [Celeribacter litoreus]|uniref:DUF6455 family protein n=1 Tax=Celeribacter litoreus TaxID=2876714 RepID=UPI001CCB543E|nr:DUF6455 family protein [Celeribacter litoreus]MCA0042810.1 DUF6455 family protein [Celeribacter litoreus]
MKRFGTFETHARLVERMATTLGVDLEERAQRGEEPSEEHAVERVYRCMSCTEPELCTRFLDLHRDLDVTAAEAPPYCRNRAELQGLADGSS